MKLINSSWFSLFSNFEEENGLEYFYFVGKLSVRLLLRALDDCLQLKIQLRIGTGHLRFSRKNMVKTGEVGRRRVQIST